MITKRSLFFICLLIASAFTSSYSQDSKSEKLRVYIEGSIIDFNYIRNNIDFVNFVNDPHSSEVHIIVTRQSTGGGGNFYTLDFNSKLGEKPGNISLTCITYSFDTQGKRRTRIVASLKSGLLPYINEKGSAENIVIKGIKSDSTAAKKPLEDPWDNWVFRIGLNGGFSGEEQRHSYNYSMGLRAKKITKDWKIINEYDYFKNQNIIEADTTIRSEQIDQDADIRYVFSINERWSWGIFFEGAQNTYRNNKLSIHLIPAIQYNIFPWSESDRREFTFSYYVGPTFNRYFSRTILGNIEELIWVQNVELDLERIETWGEIYAYAEAGHYFTKMNDYFFEGGIGASIRISKGLSVSGSIRAESIHNQRYLPASDISDEEILLNTRKLPTSFEYSGHFGIEYQFGSIYNNIVNERL